MNKNRLDFGIVGLGRMGGNLALHAMEQGIKVVGADRKQASKDLRDLGLVQIDDFGQFKEELTAPRIVFIYIPAGPQVDIVIDELVGALEPKDIIVDGGNSYWGDSIRRARRIREKSLYFADLGTSGGVSGARHGACFMAGGEKEAIKHLEPILKKLAVEDGYIHAGPPGSGHFVKLVHNGIEFGMLQAIGEGVDLLERYREKLDIAQVLRCWNHGSVIRSWLIELMHDIYLEKDGLQSVPAYIEDTGEVNWLVDDAMHMEVPTPVIAQSVMQLFTSRDEEKYWSRAIAMMRHGFGGHPYGEDQGIKRERREGRVGAFLRKDPERGSGDA